MHKLNLTVGIIPSLNVVAGLLDFFFVKSWTGFLSKLGFSIAPFTRQENTVIQSCIVACYGLAFSDVGVSRLLGSTAWFAVNRIGELLQQGKLKNIVGIPTSKQTHEQALSLGIPLFDLDKHPVLDLAIDDADEADPYLNLVKGKGGYLLGEKMVEGACWKFVVIVDESKLVDHLGGSGLAMPVEIVPFCWKFTAYRLQRLFEYAGCVAKLRTCGENVEPFVTENANYIVDLYFKKDIGDLKVASDSILSEQDAFTKD
ncbi:PREDICTED: probable ribose-5-phosphate isomerase 2 [Nelumbo nucifera]|uniref:ribose-5-phosphate isomerase n=1 Tax=Nelumbo nucifera TaxID=4432 RepID=A0A1U7ZPS1_NELNU|nr:PREDICTED: probable ribose-5-phosphate isomerase 2 [Nelumbo nucifera]